MKDDQHPETVDEKDLYEDLSEEEMRDILQQQKQQTNSGQLTKKNKPKRPFPKWVFWLIALFLFINIAAAVINFISPAAIDFVRTSAKLLMDDDIRQYKKSIVVVDTGTSRGTGFSFSSEGYVLTNEHVVDGSNQLTIYFDDEGPYSAEVIKSYPSIDLAVLDVEGEGYPYLELADQTTISEHEHIYFIGNPLRFSGIANEGSVLGWTQSSGIESEVIMLDAPVYHGNSGSPVINQQGKVIGVIYATRQTERHGKVGLAIPIDAYYEKTSE